MPSDVSVAVVHMQMLIRNAYTGGLGKPLIPDPEQVTRLTSSVLHEFAAAHYTAPNIVLAAAGVDHQELVDLVTPMLSSLPTSAPSTPSQPSSSSRSEGGSVSGLTPEPASKYIGESCVFETTGVTKHSRLFTAFTNDWLPGLSALNGLFECCRHTTSVRLNQRTSREVKPPDVPASVSNACDTETQIGPPYTNLFSIN